MRRAGRTLVGVALGALAFAQASAQDEAPAVTQFVELFAPNVIVGTPETVPCTLSGGTAANCLSLTVRAAVGTGDVGPWCPRTISDGPDKAGIWLHDGTVHDADGPFVERLATFYDDPAWQLFDPATGKVRVTDTKAACEAAARPDVDPAYHNHCVECALADVEGELLTTYVIPLHPMPADTPGQVRGAGGVGVAFNGVKFDAPAPAAAILAAHTIAPFDDCGGHVNPHDGYHYHAAAGCSPEVARVASHAAIIGVALDGYLLASRLGPDGKVPDDLDPCQGHVTKGLGYHYHAGAIGSNQTIACFKAETGCAIAGNGGVCDASQQRGGPPDGGGQPPDFSAAAATLGVSHEALQQALHEAGGPEADLAEVAKRLGVGEDDLRRALPTPPDRAPQ